ncbi:MAG: subclass B1 metallo-beta-lactamase [Bacteroidales bacterium]|nr:subclass B1 metallo-beta-lactamase [Bacteroidales bacterium]
MKTSYLLLFFFWINCSAFSQHNDPKIRVCDNIYLQRISVNAYVHVSQDDISGFGQVSSNGLIYVNNGEAFLFDSPASEASTRALVTWLTDSMKLKIVGFVPNHWHVDCMAGLAFLHSQGIPSYANQMTIDIARSHHLPEPRNGFTDSLNLKLGDRDIRCYYFGAAHSLDNIVVWIPYEKVLFSGCMIKAMSSGNLGNTADGDVKAYPATIRKVKARFPDAVIVIPGHGNFGGIELIEHTLQLSVR